jgi:zona occludens toxin (predicted ATPase)
MLQINTKYPVDKHLAAKKSNPQADTSNWEREIDRLVYKLYDLTEEEIGIVEGKSVAE